MPSNDNPSAGHRPAAAADSSATPAPRPANRRALLKALGLTGVAVAAAPLPPRDASAAPFASKPPSHGDIAILQFLAAAELIETDMWEQYAELGGITAAAPNAYQLALQNLDGDAGQYITSNTLDERSHAKFLNAYLTTIGAAPVDLDAFRTLPSSKASGARQTGRLTNLLKLSVDTSWYTRYRSAKSPDFGARFPQAIPALLAGGFLGIPASNADFGPAAHVQAIANTAAFHFAAIEQGGSSLYAAMAQKVSSAEVLEIVLGIGGDEVCHFLEWVDFAGNGVQGPIAPFTDPTNGLTFPDFNATNNELLQTNLIFPVPCEFISAKLPRCAVIRPLTAPAISAAAAVAAFAASGVFIGQSKGFTETLLALAHKADAAQRIT
jgi:hypothetical protein